MGFESRINVAYTRVSSVDQKTIDEQLKDIKLYSSLRGEHITENYSEKKSAKKDENIWDAFEYIEKRPELNRLIQDVKAKKIKKIYIWKWDRLARDSAITELILRIFRNSKVDCIATNDSNENLSRKIISVVAEEENDKKKERMELGFKACLGRGDKIGKAPIGFYWNYDKNLKCDLENREMIKGVLELVASGKPIVEIMKNPRELVVYNKNKRGTLIKSKRKFATNDIYKLCRNPIYCGYTLHNGEKFKIKEEPIVSEEIWEKAKKNTSIKIPLWLDKSDRK